ncbi:MAG: cob(I)yrinic acid a,c-diamide adenosyltransferase [Candidatus Riflebacteria bacterium]|nr:cob(I)yrinic acid a,c-diamide adenosyltransferase [Candidatus Riflebacteria bacterium]
MTIATKRGDDGTTSLWSSERVDKDDPRVDAYGTVDELSAHLGAAKHLASPETCGLVEDIQKDLFKLSGMLATRGTAYVHPLESSDLEKIESQIDDIEKHLNLKGLVIPGMTPGSAQLDICRTVARRAERCITVVAHTETIPGVVCCYMNRLSDLLFLLARKEESIAGKIKYQEWNNTKPV